MGGKRVFLPNIVVVVGIIREYLQFGAKFALARHFTTQTNKQTTRRTFPEVALANINEHEANYFGSHIVFAQPLKSS